MQVSPEVTKRLVAVIGNLICRCIEDARSIPYVLGRDEAVNILLGNPALFERLVHDEQADQVAFSKDTLTARLDAVQELRQFEALDAFDMSFGGRLKSEADLAPILDHINRLTRVFAAYVGNAVTMYEKRFELFMEKYRSSLQQAGEPPLRIRVSPADMTELEARADSYVSAGRYMQAVLFGRLLSNPAMTGQLLVMPSSEHPFNERLFMSALQSSGGQRRLVRFVLRASYISHGSWEDLVGTLLRLADRQPEAISRATITDQMGQDAVFLCNLLRKSFDELKHWSPGERSSAVNSCLGKYQSAGV